MTSEEKRQRHKEGHRSRMDAAREAEARAQVRHRLVVGAVIVVVAAVVIAAGVLLLGDDDSDDAATASTVPLEDPTDTSDPSDTSSPAEGATLPDPPPGGSIEGETPCPAQDGSEERISAFAQAPPTCIDEGEALEAEIVTSKGPLTITLDGEAAPTMVNNFVVLARYHYFDGLPFHRLVPDFVAQTGSSGIPDYGGGGPGYDMPDIEKPASYQAFDVAMARGATVSGSQFLLVASDAGASSLTPPDTEPNYPLVGRVTEGQELVSELANLGLPSADGTGVPSEVVTMESVTIRPAA